MLDEFKFPSAPKTPLFAIVCERIVGGEFNQDEVVIEDGISYPDDFHTIMGFLPTLDLPFHLVSCNHIGFVDLNGNVGTMRLDYARANYAPLIKKDASIEEHFRRMLHHKRFTNNMEAAGWNCMVSEEAIAAFADLGRPSDRKLFEGTLGAFEEPLPFDPIPKAILERLQRFAFCEACGHPHDMDTYAMDMEGCESCGAEFDGVQFLGQIFIIGSNEESMPGLDQEEWA